MKWIVLAVAVVASLTIVASALAHAEPATVSPGSNSVLATRPTQVVIETTQDMARQAGGNDIVVVDSSGKTVTTVAATIDNVDRKRISVPLPADLAVGTYTVNWKTLSADDGDDASGSYQFTYDPSKPPSAGTVTLSEVGSTPAATAVAKPAALSGGGGGGGDNSLTWVLFVATGVGMLALGSGATFLMVTKR